MKRKHSIPELNINRADYPILQGISRSAGGAVLTLDTLEAILEKYRITNTTKISEVFGVGEYVLSLNGTRKGAVGRVQIGGFHHFRPGISTFVEFDGNSIEKLNDYLRLATDVEILAARLTGNV